MVFIKIKCFIIVLVLKKPFPRREHFKSSSGQWLYIRNKFFFCLVSAYRASMSSAESPVMVAMVAVGIPAAFMPAAFLRRSSN